MRTPTLGPARFPSRDELALSKPARIARAMLAIERHYDKWAEEWSSRGETITPERLLAIKEIAANRALERDHETFHPGPRSVRPGCTRPVVLSIAAAAYRLTVDGKSDRFFERFIATGILAADQLSRQRWRFDGDELDAVATSLASQAQATRRRRQTR